MTKRVRQGDLLAPFLFILAAEILNVVMLEAVDKGIFKGIEVGKNKVTISHLQYADDTIFFGNWEKKNKNNLMGILKCFQMASGLKVNFHKSGIHGVNVGIREVKDMAAWLNCKEGSLPISYLGLPIGVNMGKVSGWNNIIDKF